MTAMPRTGKRNAVASAPEDARVALRSANPVLGLQRKIGNRATGRLLARAPATKDQGTVHIGKLPAIKILGGNAGDWANHEPRTLEITSKKGKHSAALKRLSEDGSKIPKLTVTTPISQNGQHLDFGSLELEFGRARIDGYTVDGNVEMWRAVDIETLHRTTISHKSGI
jgi:hypothetical protein